MSAVASPKDSRQETSALLNHSSASLRECVPSYCAVDDAFSDSRLIAAEAAASPRRLLVLLGMKLSITLSQGWPRGWFGGCLVTNIIPISVNLPHTFQPLSLARSGRCSLSK